MRQCGVWGGVRGEGVSRGGAHSDLESDSLRDIKGTGPCVVQHEMTVLRLIISTSSRVPSTYSVPHAVPFTSSWSPIKSFNMR